jgi:hypothetical protein
MGVPLSSPKQPQLASGRRCRISFSAPTATRTNSAVLVRTTVAGRVGQSRPNFTAVPISPRPRPSSAANTKTMMGRRRWAGNKSEGSERAGWACGRSARHALARQAPSSMAASSGICTSRMAVSMPQPPIIIVTLKQPTSRAPPSSTNAAMVRSAIRPFPGGSAGDAAVAEQPGGRPATGHRDDPDLFGAVIPQPDQAAHGQIGEPDATGRRGVRAASAITMNREPATTMPRSVITSSPGEPHC